LCGIGGASLSENLNGNAPRPDKPEELDMADSRGARLATRGGCDGGVIGPPGDGGVKVTVPLGDRGGRAAIGDGGTKGKASRIESACDDASDACDMRRSSSSVTAVGGGVPGIALDPDEPIVTTDECAVAVVEY